MSLSNLTKHYLDQLHTLSNDERHIIDAAFRDLYFRAEQYKVKAAKDDRAAELEAALVKFIMDSREG